MTGGKRLRILIVEDESIVAMLIEDMVADLGHEVVGAAARVSQALGCIGELEFDVAIIDVNLNGERTYPVAAALKQRGIPFVFATGYGIGGLADEWKGEIVLQKPFQPEELEEALRQATA